MKRIVRGGALVAMLAGAISCGGRNVSSAGDGGDSGQPTSDAPATCPAGLDLSFGEQGRYEIASGVPIIETLFAAADGEVVGVGEGAMTSPDGDSPTVFGVVRLLAGGHPDSSFGQSGTATSQILPNGRGDVVAAALQSDGTVIVAAQPSRTAVDQWLVARLNQDGDLDATFGSAGVAAAVADAYPTSVATSSGGSVVVAGTVRFPLSGYCCDGNVVVAKYDAAGGLDPTFGQGGVVRTAVGTEGGDDYASALAWQPDGRIVVGGFAFVPTGDGGARQEAMLLRYTAAGVLDDDFASGGVLLLDSYGRVNALALQDDGKLLVSLSPRERSNVFLVARFTTAGALDPTFGSEGVTSIGFALADGTVSTGTVSALSSLRDGSVLLAGPAKEENFFLMKLGSDGALDESFATNGILTTGLVDGVATAAPDGKVIIAGRRPGYPPGATVIERFCL